MQNTKFSLWIKDKDNKTLFSIILTSIFCFFFLQLIKFCFIGSSLKIVWTLFNISSVVVLIVPISAKIYEIQQKKKQVETIFPIFLKDVVEGIRGGMSLPIAINYASHNDYGALTGHIRKLSSKISWGVRFEDAFLDFTKETKSKLISRAIATIIEVYRSGGKIAEVLDKVGHSSFQIDALNKERQSTISSILMRGYIVYFIFLIVLIGMIIFLIPELIVPMTTDYQTMGQATSIIDISKYSILFLHIAIIEGIFTGLFIGKLVSGSMIDGIHHSVILGLCGYIAIIFFIA